MRRLKIVTTTWHVMHFYDLFTALKEDADFYLMNNFWRSWRRKEFLAARPIPSNVKFVPSYEPGVYDFAILDIDQQCVNKNLGKTRVYEEFDEQIKDIPKVVINHGSPVYPEFLLHQDNTKEQAEEECRNIISKMVGDNLMVVNSHEAASDREWGWGYPIWHGMDHNEWLDLPKEPRVFSALSPAGCDEYYNRDCMNEVSRIMAQDFGYELYWAKMNVKTDGSPEEYKKFLGSSLIYLDVSFRTPMNRARTEAMLSGCCIVQVKGAHDLDKFAKDGENMVLVENNPKDIARMCVALIENNYDKALAIGQAGKKMAMETFTPAKYRQAWLDLITNKLGIKL